MQWLNGDMCISLSLSPTPLCDRVLIHQPHLVQWRAIKHGEGVCPVSLLQAPPPDLQLWAPGRDTLRFFDRHDLGCELLRFAYG